MAVDPRAYDFDHPVNKRPNYHFGQWDPHHIDNQGRYRRFVVQQVTLDALLERRRTGRASCRATNCSFEAAAVLAGTMLMASGTSGSGPDAHDSTTTLSTLLPRIAAYRDAFYEQLHCASSTATHGERLRAEALAGKQPLAGARQHLNQHLARRRAAQLRARAPGHVVCADGLPEAAAAQAAVVAVAAARMACEIQCRLTTAHLADRRRATRRGARRCSAKSRTCCTAPSSAARMVDPWNILGFQRPVQPVSGRRKQCARPSRRPIDRNGRTYLGTLRTIVERGRGPWRQVARHPIRATDGATGRWWDTFATTTVESVESFSGREAFESAREVAQALEAFHAGRRRRRRRRLLAQARSDNSTRPRPTPWC